MAKACDICGWIQPDSGTGFSGERSFIRGSFYWDEFVPPDPIDADFSYVCDECRFVCPYCGRADFDGRVAFHDHYYDTHLDQSEPDIQLAVRENETVEAP